MCSAAKLFVCELQIRWSDQDLNGHVNNARILTLVEEARLLASKSWIRTSPEAMSHPRVVRSLNVDFFAPLHYGSVVHAEVWISDLGNTSYTVQHTLLQNGIRRVSCSAVVVVLDPSTRSPSQVPDDMRQLLEGAFIQRIDP